MGKLVDLDDVKKVLRDFMGPYFTVIDEMLDELAYGETWECQLCGNTLYFGDTDKEFFHAHNDNRKCDTNLSKSPTNIAIPKPKKG